MRDLSIAESVRSGPVDSCLRCGKPDARFLLLIAGDAEGGGRELLSAPLLICLKCMLVKCETFARLGRVLREKGTITGEETD